MANHTPNSKRVLGAAGALLTVLSLSLVAASASYAQGPAKGPGKGGHGAGGRKGAGISKRIAEQLNLTEAQKKQITTIQDDARKQAMAIHQDTALTQDKQQAKTKDLMKATRDKIEAILTPEQKTKMKDLREKMRAERGTKGGPAGAGAGAPAAKP